MTNKDIFTIGFMLFALFFGAGNLIYPPTLGLDAGFSYWAAISGFILTGVGLPVLAVIAISFVKDDARELADRVHPLFGLTFTSAAFLTIGPFFGIPRAATVAYEMGIQPFTSGPSSIFLFIFTAIFFILVYIISLNPSKMVDQIGLVLTPILILAIIALCVGSFFLLNNPLSTPNGKFMNSPFFAGFAEGYLTMDAIGALAFGMIVIHALKERGVTQPKELAQSVLKAGIIAGTALIVIYILIGWVGTQMTPFKPFANGGEILSVAASVMYGNFGTLLLGIIVILACFTTAVGLVVAAGQFFANATNLSYRLIVFIITAGSFIIANQGLSLIISYSVPVLAFIYPIMIVLILLSFIHPFFPISTFVYRGAILFTAIISLYDGFIEFGFSFPKAAKFMHMLPFSEIGLSWVVPALIGGIIGLIMSPRKHI